MLKNQGIVVYKMTLRICLRESNVPVHRNFFHNISVHLPVDAWVDKMTNSRKLDMMTIVTEKEKG